MTNDKTVSRVDTGKVFLEQDGSIYFLKTVETYQFLMVNPNNGENIYSKTPMKTEQTHITPEMLKFSKRETWDIFVYKTNNDELESRTEYYSMTLTFTVPSEKRYFSAFLKKVKSGRVFLTWFDSGTCSEISINDGEFTSRGKARKLAPDTILQKGSPIFTLSASGELERRLSENDIW